MAEAQEQQPSYRYAVLQKPHELCYYQQSPPVSACCLCYVLSGVPSLFLRSNVFKRLVKETVNVIFFFVSTCRDLSIAPSVLHLLCVLFFFFFYALFIVDLEKCVYTVQLVLFGFAAWFLTWNQAGRGTVLAREKE